MQTIEYEREFKVCFSIFFDSPGRDSMKKEGKKQKNTSFSSSSCHFSQKKKTNDECLQVLHNRKMFLHVLCAHFNLTQNKRCFATVHDYTKTKT